MQKAILLRVSLVERHANLYCARRDTVDFSAERGHECLAPEAFSNFTLKWFHNASRGFRHAYSICCATVQLAYSLWEL